MNVKLANLRAHKRMFLVQAQDLPSFVYGVNRNSPACPVQRLALEADLEFSDVVDGHCFENVFNALLAHDKVFEGQLI